MRRMSEGNGPTSRSINQIKKKREGLYNKTFKDLHERSQIT